MQRFWTTLAASLKLLEGRVSRAELENDIRSKYSEPVELDTARREALAGLTAGEQQLFRTYLPVVGHVLDIGCASGRVALALSRRGYTLLGIDVNEAMIRQARRLAMDAGNGAPSFAVMDTRHLGFPSASFDAVLMVGSVIGYVKGRDARVQAFREARRVLRPGGCFIVVTPSRGYSWRFRLWFLLMSLAHRALRRLGRASDWEPGDRFGPAWSGDRSRLLYWHMYSPAELQADLASADLGVIHADTHAYMMCHVARSAAPGDRASAGITSG